MAKKSKGKEFSDGSGLEWFDYGARMYDNQIGRFFTHDRYTEKYFALTPYQYGANNPTLFVDNNGDSLIVNALPGNVTAVSAYERQVNAGLGGFYTLGKTGTGKYVLNATGKEGDMTDKQREFYKTMNEIITNVKDVNFTVVDGNDALSQNVNIADDGHAVDNAGTNYSIVPGTHIIDVGDGGNFSVNGHVSAQAIIGHETKEGFEIQTRGYTTAAQMLAAHTAAIGVENLINGNVRVPNPGGDFVGNTLTLNFNVPMGVAAVTYPATVTVTFTNSQVTNITGNTPRPSLENGFAPKFKKI